MSKKTVRMQRDAADRTCMRGRKQQLVHGHAFKAGLYIAQSEKVSSGTSSDCADTLAARRLKGYVKIAFESSVITCFI